MAEKDNDENDDNTNKAHHVLNEFMDARSTPPSSWQRIQCCSSSRYIYCEICCRMLVSLDEIPESRELKGFQLPFSIHIILEDRRAASTGVQLMAVCNGSNNNPEEPDPNGIELFDIERGEVPSYDDETEGTYLLYPGEDSVPISTIVNHPERKISRLVVLDCKWSRSKSKQHPSLAKLPKVSLDEPPEKSFYWRWHNHGPGMLSTAEAIYFAAWQVTTDLGWTLVERKRMVNLLWLFRLQRSLIFSKYQTDQVRGVNPYVPFSDEAKEFSRKLRQQKQKNITSS